MQGSEEEPCRKNGNGRMEDNVNVGVFTLCRGWIGLDRWFRFVMTNGER